MESFRQLLDQWGLFSERAELDIALTAADPTRYRYCTTLRIPVIVSDQRAYLSKLNVDVTLTSRQRLQTLT